MTVSKIEFVRRWFREVWKNRRGEMIDEWIDESCVTHGLPPGSPIGPAGFRLFYEPMINAFSTIEVEVGDYVESGDEIWFSATATCTTHDGRTSTITGLLRAVIRDGRICSAQNEFNFLGMLGQLGVVPEDIFFGTLVQLAGSVPAAD